MRYFSLMQKGGIVYILCSPDKNALYVGVTSDLRTRIWQHKTHFYPKSFTAKYHCTVLVWYKYFASIEDAIAEEKRIKGGSRKKKEDLINGFNNEWKDLWDDVKDARLY